MSWFVNNIGESRVRGWGWAGAPGPTPENYKWLYWYGPLLKTIGPIRHKESNALYDKSSTVSYLLHLQTNLLSKEVGCYFSV